MHAEPARLARHPAVPWPGPELVVTADWAVAPDGTVACRYEVTGDLAGLSVPAAGPARRVDGLWRHTCFEAFAAVPGAPAYVELNFAPSGEWAAYAFSAYRVPAAAPALAAPRIRTERAATRLLLEARLDAPPWPAAAAAVEVALSAVLELADGSLGYYALTHPAPRPDFHDRRGFARAFPTGAAAAPRT
jgi:hypothetical protein